MALKTIDAALRKPGDSTSSTKKANVEDQLFQPTRELLPLPNSFVYQALITTVRSLGRKCASVLSAASWENKIFAKRSGLRDHKDTAERF